MAIDRIWELARNSMKLFFDTKYRFRFFATRGFYNYIPDEMYLRKAFKVYMGKELDLENPKSFSEKLQWLKLYDHNPLYTTMVDKYAVKEYVANTIGQEHIIPSLGVWDHFEDIDFNMLPNQFVLKCTHDSGGLVIVRDKRKLDLEAAKKKINKSLSMNYYYVGREWPYKNVKPRIIAEQFMEDGTGRGLMDYKVLCFGGIPKLIELHQGRYTNNQTQDFYDTNWNLTTISQTGNDHYQRNQKTLPRPKTLDEMLELSGVLSRGIPHIRVDWYSIEDKLYFGELTLYDGDGFVAFDDFDDDLMLGSWIELPKGQ